MTNLDTILKTRDITLPTKVHIVKATESWTTKKVENQRMMFSNYDAREDS